MNKPIKQGGLGMIDVVDLNISLKLRNLGRLLDTNHPMMHIIKNQVCQDELFYPKCKSKYYDVTNLAMETLAKDREDMWTDYEMWCTNASFVAAVKDMKICRVLNVNGLNSLIFFNLVLTKAAPLPGLTCWNSIIW